jgi:two-component system, chemotaxis family, response regulator Rcp1
MESFDRPGEMAFSSLEPHDILLVDDSQADARIFETALRDASSRARTYWIATGHEAVEFLEQRGRFQNAGPIKIVVLDLHLPGQDGFETLRRIKSDANLARTPVIVLSTSTAQHEIDLAYSLGANAFFRKPITLERYIDLVRALAQHWLDLARLPSPGHQLDMTGEIDHDESFRRGIEEDRS